MTKTLVIFVFTIFNLTSHAAIKSLPEKKISVSSPNIALKIDELIARPEQVLERYVPVGITVKNKKITGNTIEFNATKSVLGISKTVFYRGTLSLEIISETANKRCFLATQDFTGSGDLIFDAVTKFELTICAEILSDKDAKAIITPRLTEGRNPGGLYGSMATSLIIDQIDPVILAIKEVLQK